MTHEEFVEKLLLCNKHFANGEFELIGKYTHSHDNILCRCKKCGYEWDAPPSSLKLGYGCHLCRTQYGLINQEEFLNRLSSAHSNIIAIDQYIGMNKKIRFQCDKGHIWPAEPHNVLRSSGCPYCCNRKVLIGYNDMWTTRPDIAKLLKNPEDGYRYTKAAHSYTYFICPQCGETLHLNINDVCNRGIHCKSCSDGISYPNKFARAFFRQLPLDNYDYEYHPDWAKPYFYDNYFEYNGEKYIVEMDGELHYRGEICFNKSLEERQAVDEIKNNLAFQNGINIIRIDCIKSECNYIKNNILLSELNKIFDLSHIDWGLCDKMSQKSLVKQACNLYSSGIKDLNKIANTLCVDRTTVQRYVKTGAKYGWCDYDPDIARKESGNSKSIPIFALDKNDNCIHTFKSVRVCQTEIKRIYNIGLTRKSIIIACKTHKPYKGFNFRYANDTV